MLKNFTKGEKKLLKGLIMEYFHFIMMKSMKKKMKAEREIEEEVIARKRQKKKREKIKTR